ncbi:D-glycero-alpha-D-manno-heptose-1,7-bisphosphate 7-phosphatase [Gimesia panareensis]|uniref:D,D-heptose 1,7-bisphosphate phosphatase n=1 Tax=Gimesia panareensis TaxID=2527978 RepID=A0A517QC74_9PLAN|nr:D-glycero-beta-D-manno-heptose 1,7-bisphosphate 7-phosphatase [Gimesia panareensis]QDT29223.1 D-glycero-alpha-D-manno-heptose-1,7-bisphosphate 7-phosphatase [Gimesia panareensis]
MPKALFLDRDGVVNVEKHYLHRIEDCEFVAGLFDLCRAASQAGYRLIIVTNQSGIARGYFNEAQFLSLMDWVRLQFSRQNAPLLDVFYCPHHPTQGVGQYKTKCLCRKPHPQMLFDAARKHDLDLQESIIVGDKLSDIQAGRAAHVKKTVLVGTGHHVNEADKQAADLFADSLFELKNQLFPVVDEACA